MKIFSRLMKYLITKTKEKKITNKNYRLNTFLLKIFLVFSVLEVSINSEIHLVIQGSGVQKLSNIEPSEVLVNGVKADSCSKTCNLGGNRNYITLRFNTQIESCKTMFNGLKNITEIDLSNFDASKVTDMRWMFNDCSNLEKIEFGNINTPSLENMRLMFQYCSKLKSIDLSKFDASKVTDIGWMFNGCSSLIYLNLKSFKLNNTVIKGGAFNGISSNVKYCIEDIETKNVLGKKSDCSNDCFKENIKIDIEKKICIDSCLKNGYKYEYNNIYFNECPDATYYKFSDGSNSEENTIECFGETPKGYYLDLNDKTYKKCYEYCKYCYGEGNETINNCIECISNFAFYNNSMNIINCYEKCENYHYFDETNTFHCTDNYTCPNNYKLIEDKNKCIDK